MGAESPGPPLCCPASPVLGPPPRPAPGVRPGYQGAEPALAAGRGGSRAGVHAARSAWAAGVCARTALPLASPCPSALPAFGLQSPELGNGNLSRNRGHQVPLTPLRELQPLHQPGTRAAHQGDEGLDTEGNPHQASEIRTTKRIEPQRVGLSGIVFF